MTHPGYSYLDISVMADIRDLVVDQRCAVLFSENFDRVYWLNGHGATLLGENTIRDVIEREFQNNDTMMRQIIAISSRSEDGQRASGSLRVRSGWKSHLAAVTLQVIAMPDGEIGHLLIGNTTSHQPNDLAHSAEVAVDCLDGYGAASAVLDSSGAVLAGSNHFEPLGIGIEECRSLVDAVANEKDRLVKRLVKTAKGDFAAGIARLQDNPALHLLILAEAAAEVASQPIEVEATEEFSSESDEFDNTSPPEPSDETKASDAIASSPFAGAFSSKRPSLKAGDGGASVSRWYYRAPAASVHSDDVEPDSLTSGLETGDTDDEVEEIAPHTETPQPDNSTTVTTEDIAEVENFTRTIPEDMTDLPSTIVAEETGENNEDDDDGSIVEVAVESPGEKPDSQSAISVPEFDFEAGSKPVRFTFEMDNTLVFTSVSDEFPQTVGPNAADIIGRSWSDVAQVFGFDDTGTISAVLKRQDTWSGKSVLWPVQGTDLRVPIDLAGLPAFDRDRNFTGFNGFAIIRTADAVVDEEETGLALTQISPQLPGEKVENSDNNPGEIQNVVPMFRERTTPPVADAPNIVNLGDRRNGNNTQELSSDEKRAFKSIRDQLSDDTGNNISTAAGEDAEELATEPPASEDPGLDQDADTAAMLQDGIEPTIPPIEHQTVVVENIDDETTKKPSENISENEPSMALPSAFSTVSTSDAIHRVDTSILAGLPIPVLIYRDEALLFGNDAFFKLSGHPDIEAINSTGGIANLFDQDGENSGHATLSHRDGSSTHVNVHMQSVPWDANKALLLAFRQEDHGIASKIDNASTNDDDLAALAAVAKSPSTVSSFADIHSEDIGNILDTATDGVLVVSPEGILRAVNKSAEALFGHDAEEIIGEPFTILLAQESHRSARDYLAGLAGNGVASVLNDGREVIGKESHGGLIPLFLTMGKLSNSDGYCAVMRDITQWKKAEEDLVSARHQAELASEQKTDFLAKISHEIRTPLNAIIGFSDLMLEERFGRIDNDRYREYLRDINRSGSHVLDLINDLLDISKIEAGKLELEFEEVALNEIVGETVAMSQPQANSNRIIIRTSLSGSVPKVVADPRSIRQIILNLVTNAIKYTGAGGQVIVSTVYEDTGKVAIRVRDTGIGMSEGEIVTAMKPFRQINTHSKGRGEGTGLGLPLTKALVEANRAQFAIQSTPGEGTLVEIYFPSQRVLAD